MNDGATDFQDKLDAARTKWERKFWKQSGLKNAAKSADPLYFDDNDSVLTPDEAAQLKSIAMQLTGDAYASIIYDEMLAMVEAGYVSAAELLQITADFKVVPTAVLDALREQVDEFAVLINQREQAVLFGLIDDAVSAGQTPGKLAGKIAEAFADGYHVYELDDDGTPTGDVTMRIPTSAWAKMVARTELSRAQTMGQVALYKDAGINKVMWATNRGQTVCEDCAEADGDVEVLGDIFEGPDVDQPPAHPHCCCTLLPADADVAYPGAVDPDQSSAVHEETIAA